MQVAAVNKGSMNQSFDQYTPYTQKLSKEQYGNVPNYPLQGQGSVDGNPPRVDVDAIPRPLLYVNSYHCRAGIPIQFQSRSGEIPPSQSVPTLPVDEGQSTPKFMRSTTL